MTKPTSWTRFALLLTPFLIAGLACAPTDIVRGLFVSSDIWYVATTGDDANDCRSPSSACRTIQAAADKAIDGGQIQIEAGTYNENGILLGDKSLQLRGVGMGATIINGSSADTVIRIERIPPTGESIASDTKTVTIDGLTIEQGRSASDGEGGGINIRAFSPLSVVITNSRISANQGERAGGIAAESELGSLEDLQLQLLDVELVDNENINPELGGSALSNLSAQTEIRNSLISGNTGGLGALFNGNGRLTIANSEVRDNATSGVFSDRTASIGNSEIANNLADGVVNKFGELTITNSTIRNNQGVGVLNEGGGTGPGTTDVERSEIADNVLDGLVNVAGNLTILDSTINGNDRDGVRTEKRDPVQGTTRIEATTISNNGSIELVETRLDPGIGVRNQSSTVSIDGSTIIGNPFGLVALGSDDEGGFQTTITHSAIIQSLEDGMIANGLGVLDVGNSTISGNTGNGITTNIEFNRSWRPSSVEVRFLHVTVAENGGSGILAAENTTVALKNSIVANNAGQQCTTGLSGWYRGILEDPKYQSLGNNIASDWSCNLIPFIVLIKPRDLPGTDPMLQPLADNGGGTLTHATMPGSPAIDAVDHVSVARMDPSCPEDDQRGIPRHQGAACDIGAYEIEAPLAFQPTATNLHTGARGWINTTALCLEGPDIASPQVNSLEAGLAVELDARDPRNNWVRLLLEDCWVQVADVDLERPVEDLPIVEIALPTLPPPTSTFTPHPPTTIAPIKINFNADTYTLVAGGCTRLRWEVMNAETVTLDSAPVPALEAEQVCPLATTTYEMVAANPAETVERFVTIEVTIPVNPPEAPAQLGITNQVCSGQSYIVTLGWIDVADNEDGYRVYRDGALIATLGPDAKGYTDNPAYGGPYTYGVEAFNSAGASPRPTVQEAGCIT